MRLFRNRWHRSMAHERHLELGGGGSVIFRVQAYSVASMSKRQQQIDWDQVECEAPQTWDALCVRVEQTRITVTLLFNWPARNNRLAVRTSEWKGVWCSPEQEHTPHMWEFASEYEWMQITFMHTHFRNTYVWFTIHNGIISVKGCV